MSETLKVGDRVESIYGSEHRGTVIKVAAFSDGGPMYHVRRDSDGFVWIGLDLTVLRLAEMS